MIQTKKAAEAIKELHSDIEIEIVLINTLGDKRKNIPISSLGGKGVFTKEIENALINKEIDLAIHSAKDMSVYLPDELFASSILKRESPVDTIVGKADIKLCDLKKGSILGTGSLRRSIFALNKNPDIKILDIRGNIETRISKMLAGEYDAIILAKAGINRLACELDKSILESIYIEDMPIDDFIPSACQGILAAEYRRDDFLLHEIISSLIDKDTQLSFKVERKFLEAIEAGCNEPCAIYCDTGCSAPDKVMIYAMYKENEIKIIKELIDRDEAIEKSIEIGRRLVKK